MAQNPFVGAWRLVSCELRKAGGQISYPFGQDATGYLLYSQDGYMCGAFMSANRQKFVAGDILRGTTEEKVAAAETYVSYCGRYEIRGDRVVHHVEVSFFPNWIGVDQERLYSLEGDMLTLSTPPFLVGGVQQAAYLVWKRA
jgi:hypothetical protein